MARLERDQAPVGEHDHRVHVRDAREQVEEVVCEPPIADEVVAHGAVALMVEERGRADHRDREQPGGAVARPADDQQETEAEVQRAEQRLERHSTAVIGAM